MSGLSQVNFFAIVSPAEKAALEICKDIVPPFSWAKSFPEGHKETHRTKMVRNATLLRAKIFWTLLRSTMAAQKVGDFGMATVVRETESRFSIVGLGAQISPACEQDAHDSEVAICSGSKKRRVAGSVTLIRVGAICQEPRHQSGVSAGNRAGERVVAGSICRRGVDVRAFLKQVFDGFKMSEHGRQRNYGKSVGRIALRLTRLRLYKTLHSLQLPERCRFVQLHRNSPCH